MVLVRCKYNLILQDNENLDTLIKLMSDLVRTRLGIGREISLVDVARSEFTFYIFTGTSCLLKVEQHSGGAWGLAPGPALL